MPSMMKLYERQVGLVAGEKYQPGERKAIRESLNFSSIFLKSGGKNP
jgi:hypothetical protein